MVLITHWEKQKPNQPQFDHYGNIWLSFYISFSSFWFFLRESLHSFSNLFQFHNVSWSVHSFLLSLSVSFRPHSLYVCWSVNPPCTLYNCAPVIRKQIYTHASYMKRKLKKQLHEWDQSLDSGGCCPWKSIAKLNDLNWYNLFCLA